MLWTNNIIEIVNFSCSNILIIQFKSEFNYPGRPSLQGYSGYQIKHMASVRKILTNLFYYFDFLIKMYILNPKFHVIFLFLSSFKKICKIW